MKKTAWIVGVLTIFLLGPAAKAAGNNFGLGVILGSPTGISGKGYLSGTNAIDGAVAWSTGDHDGFHLHGDYLWENPRALHLDGKPIAFFYGIGARWVTWDHDHHHHHNHDHDDDYSFGARFPVGLAHTFRDPRIELFGELALVLDLVPDTDLDFDIGIGGRFYF